MAADQPAQCAPSPMDAATHERIGAMSQAIKSLETTVSTVARDVKELRRIEDQRAGAWKVVALVATSGGVIGGFVTKLIENWPS